MRILLRYLVWLFAAVALLIVLGVGGAFAWLYFYTADLPDVSKFDAYLPSARKAITDSFHPDNPHTITVIPPSEFGYIRDALIAAEGEPNPHGTLRQILDDLIAAERGIRSLERRYTRDQVVDIYVNSVYFGKNTYGIEDAAQVYFQKHASELSVAEAAYLAGLIKAPIYAKHPEKATERRDQVLDHMVENGAITKAPAEETKKIPVLVIAQPSLKR